MKSVLIFSYLVRHFKKLIPIIQKLELENEISVTVVLMTDDEKSIAQEQGIQYRMLNEFTLLPPDRDFDLGWGLEPLINAIDIIRPDMFIAIEVNYILRNAVRYCVKQRIPNLIIQHGTPNDFSLHAFAPFEGDCLATWGEHSKQFLIKHGVDSSKLVLTGGINFDKTLSLQPNKKDIANELNIPNSKRWITFTTQGVGANNRPSEKEISIAITEIARLSSRYRDYHFIFQVHPGQTIEQVKLMLNKTETNNCSVAKYKDTETLMAVSDGVVTFFSTTALDAVILSKPLMLINLIDDYEFLPFVGMGAAYGAHSKEDISSLLDKMIVNPSEVTGNSSKAAEYINYRNDGHALDRVMRLIYKKLEIRS